METEQKRCVRFLHGKAIDIEGEELVRVGFQHMKHQLYVGGKFIGEYDNGGDAIDAKKTIDLALASAYVCDSINRCDPSYKGEKA